MSQYWVKIQSILRKIQSIFSQYWFNIDSIFHQYWVSQYSVNIQSIFSQYWHGSANIQGRQALIEHSGKGCMNSINMDLPISKEARQALIQHSWMGIWTQLIWICQYIRLADTWTYNILGWQAHDCLPIITSFILWFLLVKDIGLGIYNELSFKTLFLGIA